MTNLSPILLGIISIGTSFIITYVLTRYLIGFLKERGRVVMDYHKPERNLVPHPGGIAILAGLVIPELILFAITQELGILAIALTTLIAGIIGLTDDFRTLGGVIKPLLLMSLKTIILNGSVSLKCWLAGSAAYVGSAEKV